MGNVTRDFSYGEFACKCGCGTNKTDIALIHRLQVVRDIIGVPINIHCGTRCKEHNASVGGKEDSLHLYGQAADWDAPGYSPVAIAEMLHEWSGGFHVYEWGFHTDVGAKRRW